MGRRRGGVHAQARGYHSRLVTSITIETHPEEAGRRGAIELTRRLRARVPRKDERPIEVIMREAIP